MIRSILLNTPLPADIGFAIPAGQVTDMPQIVSDGGFNGSGPAITTSGSGTFSVTGGQGRITNGAAAFGQFALTSIPTVPGRTYRIKFTIIAGTSSGLMGYNFGGADVVVTAAGAYEATFVAITSTLSWWGGTNSNVSGQYASFDDLSLTLDQTAARSMHFQKMANLRSPRARWDFQAEWIFYGNSAARYWDTPDAYYDGCLARGIKPLFCLVSIPGWAQPSGGNGLSYTDASQLSAMASCMQAAAARYPKADWELRNEQNFAPFSTTVASGASLSVCAAAYMTEATALAAGIRAGNSGAKIISAGLSPADNTVLGSNLKCDDYLTALYANGAATVFDHIGFHPYPWPNRVGADTGWSGWRQMRDLIWPIVRANNPRQKIWLTEMGAPTGGSTNTPITQAQLRQMVYDVAEQAARTDWIGPVYWYSLLDKGASYAGSTDTEDYFGAYDAAGIAKPAVEALLHVVT